MNRVKIEQPTSFCFKYELNVPLSAINYGNHVGNDAFFTLAHEARLQWLYSLGYTELNVEGKGIIMIDATIQYLTQLFHNERIQISIAIPEVYSKGFTIVYLFENISKASPQKAALLSTNMLFFDYATKNITETPQHFIEKLQNTPS
jgi:acyl-CoA thioester hydrolase